jgi:hypothetical protein
MNIIDDIRSGCSCSGVAYCPLEEFVRHLPARTLVQHKCVEHYKLILSSAAGHDVGWPAAYDCWISDGLAARFADIWQPDLLHDEALFLLGLKNRRATC